MKILTKEAFKALQEAGKLGNYFQTWSSLSELRESGYEGWATVRSKVRGQRQKVPARYELRVAGSHTSQLEGLLKELRREGIFGSGYYLQEIPPPGSMRRLNAELLRDERYLYLEYVEWTDENLRTSLTREAKRARGLDAVMVLKRHMGPDDYDELHRILSSHPDAVVEMTVWAKSVGIMGKPTMIWEVRDF